MPKDENYPMETRPFYGSPLPNPLMLGTALYPSPAIMREAFFASQASVATLSLRREGAGSEAGQDFWGLVQELVKRQGIKILPNTAGCYSVKEAVTTAHMARDIFDTSWIKLEVISNSDSLNPDVMALVEAARILCDDGFQVFPYCTEDLSIAEKLLMAGCNVLMPWGAPIGSGQGLTNPFGLRSLRAHFPEIPMVIDAGLGLPSHAAQGLEMGFDAILLNTAVAKAGDPVRMAQAFAQAAVAGRQAALAQPVEARDMASPSTPLIGKAFLE